MNYRSQGLWQRVRYILNLPQSGKLVWNLLWDKRVSKAGKGIFLGLGALYFLLPTDIIPDFIPVFGELDDLGVIIFLTDQFIKHAPQDIVREYSKN